MDSTGPNETFDTHIDIEFFDIYVVCHCHNTPFMSIMPYMTYDICNMTYGKYVNMGVKISVGTCRIHLQTSKFLKCSI